MAILKRTSMEKLIMKNCGGQIAWAALLIIVIVLFNSTSQSQLNGQAADPQGIATQALPAQNQGPEELPPPADDPGAFENPFPSTVNQMQNGIAMARPFDTSVRIIDVVTIQGDQENHLEGVGLVSGLSQTGGRAEVTQKMMQNYFLRNGLPIGTADTTNLSAVIVTAVLPPHTRATEKISVTVSSTDGATSLFGGNLLRSVLRGIDGEIYAVASGKVTAGGLAAGGAAANVRKDHPTAGSCDAIVVREVCSSRLQPRYRIQLLLRNKDALTAVRIANRINEHFPNSAHAVDPGAVDIAVPETFCNNSTAFISMIGEMRIVPNTSAKVIINPSTGTVVMGENVRISKVLFANENLVIGSTETPLVSQPAPFSRGRTTVLPRTQVRVFESGGTYSVVNEGVTVGELANALNTLRVPPADLIQLFDTLRDSGALQAELKYK